MAKANKIWVCLVKDITDDGKEVEKLLTTPNGVVMGTTLEKYVKPLVKYAKQVAIENGLDIKLVEFNNPKIIELIKGKH